MHTLTHQTTHTKISPLHHTAIFSLFFVLLLIITGCSIPISYYDATTYTHLTGLKVETTMLIQTFDSKPVNKNENRIEQVTMNFRKAHEYEKGKGKPNSDTALQFEKLIKLFDDDVASYRDNGPKALGTKYYQQAAIALGQAFDIAIATENLKNKDKR